MIPRITWENRFQLINPKEENVKDIETKKDSQSATAPYSSPEFNDTQSNPFSVFESLANIPDTSNTIMILPIDEEKRLYKTLDDQILSLEEIFVLVENKAVLVDASGSHFSLLSGKKHHYEHCKSNLNLFKLLSDNPLSQPLLQDPPTPPPPTPQFNSITLSALASLATNKEPYLYDTSRYTVESIISSLLSGSRPAVRSSSPTAKNAPLLLNNTALGCLPTPPDSIVSPIPLYGASTIVSKDKDTSFLLLILQGIFPTSISLTQIQALEILLEYVSSAHVSFGMFFFSIILFLAVDGDITQFPSFLRLVNEGTQYPVQDPSHVDSTRYTTLEEFQLDMLSIVSLVSSGVPLSSIATTPESPSPAPKNCIVDSPILLLQMIGHLNPKLLSHLHFPVSHFKELHESPLVFNAYDVAFTAATAVLFNDPNMNIYLSLESLLSWETNYRKDIFPPEWVFCARNPYERGSVYLNREFIDGPSILASLFSSIYATRLSQIAHYIFDEHATTYFMGDAPAPFHIAYMHNYCHHKTLHYTIQRVSLFNQCMAPLVKLLSKDVPVFSNRASYSSFISQSNISPKVVQQIKEFFLQQCYTPSSQDMDMKHILVKALRSSSSNLIQQQLQMSYKKCSASYISSYWTGERTLPWLCIDNKKEHSMDEWMMNSEDAHYSFLNNHKEIDSIPYQVHYQYKETSTGESIYDYLFHPCDITNGSSKYEYISKCDNGAGNKIISYCDAKKRYTLMRVLEVDKNVIVSLVNRFRMLEEGVVCYCELEKGEEKRALLLSIRNMIRYRYCYDNTSFLALPYTSVKVNYVEGSHNTMCLHSKDKQKAMGLNDKIPITERDDAMQEYYRTLRGSYSLSKKQRNEREMAVQKAFQWNEQNDFVPEEKKLQQLILSRKSKGRHYPEAKNNYGTKEEASEELLKQEKEKENRERRSHSTNSNELDSAHATHEGKEVITTTEETQQHRRELADGEKEIRSFMKECFNYEEVSYNDLMGENYLKTIENFNDIIFSKAFQKREVFIDNVIARVYQYNEVRRIQWSLKFKKIFLKNDLNLDAIHNDAQYHILRLSLLYLTCLHNQIPLLAEFMKIQLCKFLMEILYNIDEQLFNNEYNQFDPVELSENLIVYLHNLLWGYLFRLEEQAYDNLVKHQEDPLGGENGKTEEGTIMNERERERKIEEKKKEKEIKNVNPGEELEKILMFLENDINVHLKYPIVQLFSPLQTFDQMTNTYMNYLPVLRSEEGDTI